VSSSLVGAYGTVKDDCLEYNSDSFCSRYDGFPLERLKQNRRFDVFVGDDADLMRIQPSANTFCWEENPPGTPVDRISMKKSLASFDFCLFTIPANYLTKCHKNET
jgi:hypothetical protein